ncbi:MAG TPA: hypothetical protein DCP93_05400 [Lachnospiraceae bacterium]|nr:hypothetical protein [Lachnospiraceae bacterium]
MEFNKPVSNPMMVGSIELLKAEDTPEHRQMFLDELQKAKFLSPVVIDPVPVPDENGRVTIARDAKVQFPMLSTEDGRKFFMAFTDWTELKRWRDEENQQTFAMNFDDYAGMLLRKDAQGNISPALGFVINPFGGNIVVTREMVASMIAAKLKAVGRPVPPAPGTPGAPTQPKQQ